MTELINCPAEAYQYEFIVAHKTHGYLVYHSHYTDGFKAFAVAESMEDGVVFHNLRIQGKQK